jgi:hypothetical protein
MQNIFFKLEQSYVYNALQYLVAELCVWKCRDCMYCMYLVQNYHVNVETALNLVAELLYICMYVNEMCRL